MKDVNPDRFENAGLGFFDGGTKAVDAGQVFAIGVILLAFLLDRDWIGLMSHGISTE